MQETVCDNNPVITDILSRIVVPIISTVAGAIISGVATYMGAKWQYDKKEKREIINAIGQVLTDLQIATSSNFIVSDIQNAEKAVSDVMSAYAVFLRTTEAALLYLPQNVRKSVETYRDLTYRNITVWSGKVWGNPIYKDDPSPYMDQTSRGGKAKKAYDEARASLSRYASGEKDSYMV